MQNGKKKLGLSIVEKVSDYGKKSRRVLFGPCSTTTTCCIWSLAGFIAGAVGYSRGWTEGEERYAPVPKEMSANVHKGMFAGCSLFAIAFSAVFSFELFIGLVFLGGTVCFIPAAIGGAIGAKFSEYQNAQDPAGSRRAVYWSMVYMVIASLAFTLFIFAPCALLVGAVDYAVGAATGGAIITVLGTLLPSESRPRLAGGKTSTPSRLLNAPPVLTPDKSLELENLIVILDESDNEQVTARCPVCSSQLGDEDLTVCDACETPHHSDCWEYTGGCAIFGCASKRQKVTDQGPAPVPRPSIDYPRLRGLAYDWFWASRLRWWSYVAAIVSLLVVPLGYSLSPTTQWIEDPLLLAMIFFMVFGILSVPSLIYRQRLREIIMDPLEPSDNVVSHLTARFERSRSESLLIRMANKLPLCYLATALGVLMSHIAVFGVNHSAFPTIVLLLLIGLSFSGHLAARAKRRQAVIEAITGRILISQAVQNRQRPAL